jgi:hypothetical protein
MLLLQAVSQYPITVPITDRSSILTPGEFIAIFAILTSILAGVISQWIWMRSKMAEHDVRIAEMETKINASEKERAEDKEKMGAEIIRSSREVTSTFVRVFEKMEEITEHLTTNKDELKTDISNIRVFCAGHDARARDQIVQILKDHQIIKT